MTKWMRAMALVCGVGVMPCSALAQSDEPALEAEATEEPASEETDGGLGSLDELLGLEESGASDAPEEELPELAEQGEVELERNLTDQEARQALVSAAQQMREASFRLGDVKDPGVVTQRLQQEVITKLDVLIRFAEQQQQQQQSSSSSQQQQQQNQQNQQQQQGQRAEQQQQQQQSGGGEPQDGMRDIPFEQGRRDVIDSDSAGWGELPERVRERLVEGSSDYFSTLYEALTEAYYRRLAEEASE